MVWHNSSMGYDHMVDHSGGEVGAISGMYGIGRHALPAGIDKSNPIGTVLVLLSGITHPLNDTMCMMMGFERAGFTVDYANWYAVDGHLADVPLEDYRYILIPWQANALWASKGTVLDSMKELLWRAHPNSVLIDYDDTTFAIDTKLWNKNDSQHKESVYASAPITVVGSFDKAILKDSEAMGLIQSKMLRKLHPDSLFVPVQWLSFNVWLLDSWLSTEAIARERGEFRKSLFDDVPETVSGKDATQHAHSFYYGLDKKKLVPSLRELGIGEDVDDGVFGKIANLFPDVRNLSEGLPKNKFRSPAEWADIARTCNRLLVPYEPVKGDYQLTRRMLEAHYLNPEGTVADPRLDKMMALVNAGEPFALETAKYMISELDRLVY